LVEPKKRRISSKDWDEVESFVNDELDKREKSEFRREHEKIWKEVDRQLQMREMKRVTADGKPVKWSWQNAMELGELAKASEIICADVMRIMFPSKMWFEPHAQIKWPTNPQTGGPQIDEKRQKMTDGLIRNLMTQQHKDFGFKERFQLSVKEALAHGSFVAECRWQKSVMVKEGTIKEVAAPVWVPYSMWNAYPDPSSFVIGGEVFYPGSMIVKEFCTLARFKQMAKDSGWMMDRVKKVDKSNAENKENRTDEVTLVKYCGDVFIERTDGDIYLPNSKVVLANNILVYWEEESLPYSPFIYGGYERADVRDPLYTSPIIKQSPMQKGATIVFNKFLDAVALKVEPPVEYDGNDPDYVATDGPVIAPGSKNPRKSGGKAFEALDIGDPRYASEGMQYLFRQLQEGLGVSSLRTGVQSSDRQTATEAQLLSQGSEVRTMDFIASLERKLPAFLYMQHELNRTKMSSYSFYNDVQEMPDYITVTKNDIKGDVVFEVVGAKGVLGEKERTQKLSAAVAFFSQSPLFAPKLKVDQVMQDMLADAGKKNPEEWVKVGNDPQADAEKQQMVQIIQQLQQELKDAQQGVAVDMKKIEAQMMKWQADAANKQAQSEIERMRLVKEVANDRASQNIATAELKQNQIDKLIQIEKIQADADAKNKKIMTDMFVELQKIAQQAEAKIEETRKEMAKSSAKPVKKEVNRTADGFQIVEYYENGETKKKNVKRKPRGYTVQ